MFSSELWQKSASGGGGVYPFQIEQSCRFTAASNDSLSRSFGTSSNLAKFTFSCWIKNEPTGNMSRFNTNGDTHYIGALSGANYDLDAYLAEVNFADGQSYGPDQFGESFNGVWQPISPTGTTYGTNGFRLDFANSSDLGNDVSGNSNDWTTVSGTLGTDHKVLDSPTFGD